MTMTTREVAEKKDNAREDIERKDDNMREERGYMMITQERREDI